MRAHLLFEQPMFMMKRPWSGFYMITLLAAALVLFPGCRTETPPPPQPATDRHPGTPGLRRAVRRRFHAYRSRRGPVRPVAAPWGCVPDLLRLYLLSRCLSAHALPAGGRLRRARSRARSERTHAIHHGRPLARYAEAAQGVPGVLLNRGRPRSHGIAGGDRPGRRKGTACYTSFRMPTRRAITW